MKYLILTVLFAAGALATPAADADPEPAAKSKAQVYIGGLHGLDYGVKNTYYEAPIDTGYYAQGYGYDDYLPNNVYSNVYQAPYTHSVGYSKTYDLPTHYSGVTHVGTGLVGSPLGHGLHRGIGGVGVTGIHGGIGLNGLQGGIGLGRVHGAAGLGGIGLGHVGGYGVNHVGYEHKVPIKSISYTKSYPAHTYGISQPHHDIGYGYKKSVHVLDHHNGYGKTPITHHQSIYTHDDKHHGHGYNTKHVVSHGLHHDTKGVGYGKTVHHDTKHVAYAKKVHHDKHHDSHEVYKKY